MLAWTLVVPLLKRFFPLPALARLMWADERAASPHRGQQQRIVRAARRLLRARSRRSDENCLDRSLVLYRFLSMASLDPRVVLGVRREGDGVIGHAWVTVDGAPVVEGSVSEFIPIATIGPAGVVEAAGDEPPEAAFDALGVRA